MKSQRSFAEFIGDTAAGMDGLNGPLNARVHHQAQAVTASGSHVQAMMHRAQNQTQLSR